MHTWKEPLDQTGDATYSIDFTKEMTRLGETLSSVVPVLSAEAVTAGLVMGATNIDVANHLFTVKFSIPDVAKRVFTRKGTVLRMKITYSSSGGEKDAGTFQLIVKDK